MQAEPQPDEVTLDPFAETHAHASHPGLERDPRARLGDARPDDAAVVAADRGRRQLHADPALTERFGDERVAVGPRDRNIRRVTLAVGDHLAIEAARDALDGDGISLDHPVHGDVAAAEVVER